MITHLSSISPRLKWIFGGLLLAVWLAGCGPSNPIDTNNPIDFAPQTKIFSMKVPGSWTQVQNEVPTEYMAAFADPSHRAEMIAYVGLLDHQLTDEEGFKAISGLIANLLNHPADLTVTDQQRRADGTFDLKFSFTRNNEKRSGEAVFSGNNLALAGVLSEGPEAFWPALSNALQPFVKSFQIAPDNVKGAYFAPVENVGFSFAAPADWPQQTNTAGAILHSLSGQMTIAAMQRPLTGTLDTPALQNLAVEMMAANGLPGKVTKSETLPDGRLKLTFDRPKHRVIGYVDQKDQVFAGLFFDVPSDQADAYQPFIDFVYSTFVTGKP